MKQLKIRKITVKVKNKKGQRPKMKYYGNN